MTETWTSKDEEALIEWAMNPSGTKTYRAVRISDSELIVTVSDGGEFRPLSALGETFEAATGNFTYHSNVKMGKSAQMDAAILSDVTGETEISGRFNAVASVMEEFGRMEGRTWTATTKDACEWMRSIGQNNLLQVTEENEELEARLAAVYGAAA